MLQPIEMIFLSLHIPVTLIGTKTTEDYWIEYEPEESRERIIRNSDQNDKDED